MENIENNLRNSLSTFSNQIHKIEKNLNITLLTYIDNNLFMAMLQPNNELDDEIKRNIIIPFYV